MAQRFGVSRRPLTFQGDAGQPGSSGSEPPVKIVSMNCWWYSAKKCSGRGRALNQKPWIAAGVQTVQSVSINATLEIRSGQSITTLKPMIPPQSCPTSATSSMSKWSNTPTMSAASVRRETGPGGLSDPP